MDTYLALLRGINVGGRTQLGMDALRQLCADLGHRAVRTYLRSGNVVFETAAGAEPADLAAAIQGRIADKLELAVTVLIRTAAELAAVAGTNPFLDRQHDLTKLHVAFLAAVPDPERAAQLAVPAGEPEELVLRGREVYLHYPNGAGRTKVSNVFLERRLGVAATSRNWRTVIALHDLSAGATT